MRIRITIPPCVGARHGVDEGEVFKVIDPPNGRDSERGKWIMGRAGEPVLVLHHEFEVVDLGGKGEYEGEQARQTL